MRNGRTANVMADRIADMGTSIREIGDIVKEAVTEKLAELKDGAAALGAEGKRSAKAAGESLKETVESNPIPSLLIALGAGALCGWYLGRKS